MSHVFRLVGVFIFLLLIVGNVSFVNAQIRKNQPSYAQKHQQYQQAPQRKGLKAFRKKNKVHDRKMATQQPKRYANRSLQQRKRISGAPKTMSASKRTRTLDQRRGTQQPKRYANRSLQQRKRISGGAKPFKQSSTATFHSSGQPSYRRAGNGKNIRSHTAHKSQDVRRPMGYKKEFKYQKDKPKSKTRYTATRKPKKHPTKKAKLANQRPNYAQNFRPKHDGFQRVRVPKNKIRNTRPLDNRRRITPSYANRHRTLDRRNPSTGMKIMGAIAAPFALPFIKKHDNRRPYAAHHTQRRSLDGRKPYAFNRVSKGRRTLDSHKPNYRKSFAQKRRTLDRKRPSGYKREYAWLKDKPQKRSKYTSAGTNRRKYAARHNRIDSRRVAGHRNQNHRSFDRKTSPSRATKILGALSLPLTWPFLLNRNTDRHKASTTYKNRHHSRDFHRPRMAYQHRFRNLDRKRPSGYKREYAWLKDKPQKRSKYTSAGTNRRKYAARHGSLDHKRSTYVRLHRRGLDRQRPLGYKREYAWLKDKPQKRSKYTSAGTNRRKYATRHGSLDHKRSAHVRLHRRGLDRQRPSGYKREYAWRKDKPQKRSKYTSAGTNKTLTTIGAILLAPVAWPALLLKKNLDNRRAKSYADRHRTLDTRRFSAYRNRHTNIDTKRITGLRYRRNQLDSYKNKSYAFKRKAHDLHRIDSYARRHAMLDTKRPYTLHLRRNALDQKRIVGMRYNRNSLDQKHIRGYKITRLGPNNICQPRLIIRHRNYDLACMPQYKPLRRRQLDLACTERHHIIRHKVVDRLCYETNKVCHIPMKDYRVPCDPNFQAPTSNMERVGKELKYFFTNKKKYCKINSVYSGVSAGQVVETEEYGIAVVTDFILKDRILKYPQVVYGKRNKKVKEKVREKKIKGVRNLVVLVPKDPKKMRKRNGQANLKKVVLSQDETKQIMIQHLMKKDNMLWIVRMYPEEEQNIPVLRVKYGLDKEIHHPAFRK